MNALLSLVGADLGQLIPLALPLLGFLAQALASGSRTIPWRGMLLTILGFGLINGVALPLFHDYMTAIDNVAQAMHDKGKNCQSSPRQPFLSEDCRKTRVIANSWPSIMAVQARADAISNWFLHTFTQFWALVFVVAIVAAIGICLVAGPLNARRVLKRTLNHHQALDNAAASVVFKAQRATD